VTRFTEIVVRATVTAAPGTDIEVLRRAIDKTTTHCLVSSSLVTPVRVDAVVHTTGAAGTVDEPVRRTA
jgi:hypothetical protein